MFVFIFEFNIFGFQNSYNKEIDELNKEAETIETNSERNELKLKSQIDNLNEKLKEITTANATLETELKKNKI